MRDWILEMVDRVLSEIRSRLDGEGRGVSPLESGKLIDSVDPDDCEEETPRAVMGEVSNLVVRRSDGQRLGGTSHLYTSVGNSDVGERIEQRLVTASGEVVKPEEVRSVCSVCGEPEAGLSRSSVSGEPLCAVCGLAFETEEGRVLLVSKKEYQELYWEYNTWKGRGDLR